jgi:hypothetical protein
LLRIDPKFLHSCKQRRAVHSQASGSTIGTSDTPLACGERPYDLIALLSFIIVSNARFVVLQICSFSNEWLDFAVGDLR